MSVPTTPDIPDDIDEIAVERACRGDRTVRLNRTEMRAAWLILERRGTSSYEIAAILGVAARTVVRWRSGATDPSARRASAATRAPQSLLCPDCGERFAAHLGRHRRRQHADQLRSA